MKPFHEIGEKRCRPFTFFIGMLTFIALMTTALLPKPTLSADVVDTLQKEARSVREKIERNKARQRGYGKEEEETIQSLRDLEKSLYQARKAAGGSEKALAELQAQITENRRALERLDQRIEETRRYAARRMANLYKLNALGRLSILASAESMGNFLERRHSLRVVLDHDRDVMAELNRRIEERRATAKQLEVQRKERAALVERHQREAKLLAHQKEQREGLLAKIRKKKALTRAAIDSLSATSRDLERRIETLSAEREAGVEVGSGQFAALKGLLKMPVNGNIVSHFGRKGKDQGDIMNIQSGITIAAGRGEAVKAVHDGEVIFANWFRGYGNMMIIDHGDHYYTIYAHTDELFRTEGERVAAGDVIATVGDSGTAGTPMLHFEVRHHGKPLNPLKWLKKG